MRALIISVLGLALTLVPSRSHGQSTPEWIPSGTSLDGDSVHIDAASVTRRSADVIRFWFRVMDQRRGGYFLQSIEAKCSEQETRVVTSLHYDRSGRGQSAGQGTWWEPIPPGTLIASATSASCKLAKLAEARSALPNDWVLFQPAIQLTNGRVEDLYVGGLHDGPPARYWLKFLDTDDGRTTLMEAELQCRPEILARYIQILILRSDAVIDGSLADTDWESPRGPLAQAAEAVCQVLLESH